MKKFPQIFTIVIALGARAALHAAIPTRPPDPDGEWDRIAAIVDSRKAGQDVRITAEESSRSVRAYPGLQWAYLRWVETSNRYFREAGLSFYTKYPNDPRRWDWLLATLQRPVRYYSDLSDEGLKPKKAADGHLVVPVDEKAQSEWKNRREELVRAFLNATDARPEDQAEFQMHEIAEELRFMGIRSLVNPQAFENYDFVATESKIAALATKYPDYNFDSFRSATKSVIAYAKHAKGGGGAIGELLKNSPNEAVRNVARSESLIAKARVEPMEIKFTAIDGREVDLAKMRGQVVMIDFRGITWCSACLEEEDALHAVYKKYHDAGFEMICITFEPREKDREHILKYTKERGMTWPHYFDGKGRFNPFIARFGITGVPEHFIIGKDGLLVEEWLGGPTSEADLEAMVRKALGLPPLPTTPGKTDDALKLDVETPDATRKIEEAPKG